MYTNLNNHYIATRVVSVVESDEVKANFKGTFQTYIHTQRICNEKRNVYIC